jgi:hypothetical protein
LINVAISLGTLFVKHPVLYHGQHFHDESQVHISAVSVQYVPRFVHVNPLNAELNPICHLLALLGGATIVVVSRLRVKDEEQCHDPILFYAVSLFFFTFHTVTADNTLFYFNETEYFY